MIEIIAGGKSSAISNLIYKDIEKRLEEGKKSILIVPEQYTLETDIEFLKSISFKSVMDAKVLSFSSFESFILDRVKRSDKKFLNREGKVMVLSNIIQDLDLRLFKGAHKNLDFVDSLVDLISSFKENKIGDDFYDRLDSTITDKGLRIKFKDIRMIAEAYEKSLGDSYFDSEDMTSFVAETIGDLDFLSDYAFYFDKFDSMEDRKIDLIEALYKKDLPIKIGLNIDPSYLKISPIRPEIFDPAFNFYIKLRDNFKTRLLGLGGELKSPDLDHMRKNFESFSPDIYEGRPENIRVFESISTRTELENIGLFINKVIKTKDLRFNDFAVYITDEDEYENELIKTFERFDIPFFLDKRRKMADNHLIKTLFALIRLLVNKYRSEDLYYVLNSGLIDFKDDPNILINFIRDRNIRGLMFEEDKYFDLDLEFYEKFYENDPLKEQKLSKKKEEYQAVENIRAKILDLLSYIRIDDPRARDLAEGVYKIIADTSFKRGIADFKESLEATNRLADLKELDQVLDELMDTLDQLVLLMGDRKVSLERVYSLIEAAAKDIKIGLIPPSKDHLTVTDFKRERVSNKPISIVLGLSDAYFPSAPTGDFIISEKEKEDLKDEGLDLKLYNKDLGELEKLNLYKLFVGSDKLILSYPLADKKGKDLNKSYVLKEILNIFKDLPVKSLAKIEVEDLVYSKEASKKHALNTLTSLKKGENIEAYDEDFARDFIAYLKKNIKKDDNKKIYESTYKGLTFSNDKKPLVLSKDLFRKNSFSVSEIESYSRCPYKHFVGYGLRPDEGEDFDINHMEIGNIVHKSLEDLSKLLKEEDLDDISEERLDKLLEENFKKGVDLNLDKTRKESHKNTYVLNNMLNTAKRNAREIKRGLAKGAFKLDSFEEDFDKGGLFEPVYLDEENYLRGRIDRIDRAGDLVKIIDYKTGAKSFKVVNVLNGLDLQLIVYMIAVAESGKKLFPIGSFYLPLKDEIKKIDKMSYTDEKNLQDILKDKFALTGLLVKLNENIISLIDEDFDGKSSTIIDYDKKNILSPDDFERLSDFTRDLIKEIIDSIKEGKIDLKPVRMSSNVKECTYCAYREVCKFDEIIDSYRFRDIDKSKSIKDLEEK